MDEHLGVSPILLVPKTAVTRIYAGGNGRTRAEKTSDSPSPVIDRFSQATWITLATLHPDLMRNFMIAPRDPATLLALLSAPLNGYRTAFSSQASGRKLLGGNITGFQLDELGTVFTLERIERSNLYVLFKPATGQYRVEAQSGRPEKRIVDSALAAGAWSLSTIGRNPVVGHLIERFGEQALQGAHVLFIPPDAQPVAPRILPLSQRYDRRYIEFLALNGDPLRGSSTALLVNDVVRERLRVDDVLSKLKKAADEARASGFEPAAAIDLDGTLFNAREFAGRMFKEWLAQHDGPESQELRAKVQKAGAPLRGWNNEKILELYGYSQATHPELIADAMTYYNKHFFNPQRRLEMLRIEGTVKLVRILQKEFGIKAIYVTLRSAEDDNAQQGGRTVSVAKTHLKESGIFEEGSVLLRHTGEKINWSKGTRDEPPKREMLALYLATTSGTIKPIAAIDNDVKHLAEYAIGYPDIIRVHIKGDIPLDSPDLEDDAVISPSFNGIFTTDPDTLQLELGELEDEIQQRAYRTEWHMGERAADETMSLMWRLDDDARSTVTELAHDISDVVADMVQLDSSAPTKQGFIEMINWHAAQPNGMTLETIEDVLDVVNEARGTHLATVRNASGLTDVVDLSSGAPSITANDRSHAAHLNLSPLTALSGIDLASLADMLSYLPRGPRFNRDDLSSHFTLAYGEYPAMEFVLRAAVGALAARFGTRPEEMRAIEFGPRRAIPAMTTLARMGLSVYWQDPSVQKAFHTRSALDALPDALRARIVHAPLDHTIRAQLALLNSPMHSMPVDRFADNVMSGGLMIAQYTEPPAAAPSPALWRPVASINLPPDQLVFPTAFAHLAPSTVGLRILQKI